MIEAFDLVAAKLPETRLVIAGGDHPQAAGYTDLMRQLCADRSRIEFLGYVPEDALPDLFQSASLAVMPYSSSTGCSGVAHLACAYGVPIVSADLADFRQMAQGEDLAIEFYPPGNAQGLADCLIELLQNEEKQQTMAAQNFSAALCMTMPNVVQKYLRHFELQRRTRALRYVSRTRRLPGWVPSKSLLLRFMNRNSLNWARRSAILHTSWNGRDDFRSLHGNEDGRGQLNGSRAAVYGDGVIGRGILGGVDRGRGSTAAGNGTGNHHSQTTSSQESQQAPALELADQRAAHGSEAEKPNGKHLPSAPQSSVMGDHGMVGDGENGVHGAAAGSNRRGIEGTSQGGGQPGAA